MSISQEKVWMKYYDADVAQRPMPKSTAYSFMTEENKDRMDKTAVHYYGTNITHAQLQKNIEECARAFAALGVKKGDIVSFLTVAVPETIAALYALNRLGATANAIDPRMDIENIKQRIIESESHILIVIDIAWPKVAAIKDDIKQDYIIPQNAFRSLSPIKKLYKTLTTKKDVPYGGNILKWDQFLAMGKGVTFEDAPYVGDDVVAITYTGGTTGLSKGVMLTNDSMNAAAINFKYAGIDYNLGDRFLGIIPIFSAYGMVCGVHMPLVMNTELVTVPDFSVDKFGKLVKMFRPNHMLSTPAFYETLINSKEMQGMKDLSFLTTMGSGGDTMNEGLEAKLNAFIKEKNMPYPLAQGYGMSELAAAASFCVNDRYKPNSVGIPSVTTNISVFDPDTGKELGYNQNGEICISGPSLMKGYFKRPEETANVMRLHDDGQIWMHSGDIGYMDEDGFLYIIGRVKRMITRFDGHKVFPVNLESMISEHPAVRNCSVIGVRDMERLQGHYPMVLVELAAGVDQDAICKELYEDCHTRAEERGRPVAVVAIDAIPLTGFGKNDYRALEVEYKDYDYLTWQADHL